MDNNIVFNKSLSNKKNFYPAMLAMPIAGILYKTVAFFGMMYSDNPYSINVVAGLKAALPTCYVWGSLLVFIFSFALMFRSDRGRLTYLVVTDIVYTVNCYFYVAYYRYFNDFPSILSLLVLKSTNSDMPSDFLNLLMPINVVDTLYFLDFMLLYMTGLVYRYYSIEKNVPFAKRQDKPVAEFASKANVASAARRSRRRTSAFVTIVTCFLVLVMTLCIVSPTVVSADGQIRQDFSKAEKKVQATMVSPLGVLANDIVATIARYPEYKLAAEKQAYVNDYYEWKNAYYAIDEHYGRFQGKNVVFIQFEAFEDFVVGESILGQEITPNINRLLGHGYHFTNVRENVKHGNSSDGDILYVGGVYPSSKASTSNVYGYNVFNGTPKILRKSGYKSAYFSCDELSAWNYEPLAISLGYDEVVFNFDQSHRINTYISDKSMYEQTIQKLVELKYNEEKFYSHTVIYSNHAPFRMPKEIQELTLPKELEGTYTGDYLQSVHYSDKCIGVFIDKLEENGLLDNTVVVIAGDHRGLHKYFPTDVTGLKETESTSWIPKNADVPVGIVIYDPTMDEGIEIDKNASQVDVQPTLLYLLGTDFDLYKNSSMGMPIFCKYDASISSSFIFRGDLEGSGNDYNSMLYNAFYVADIIYESDYFGEEYVDGHEVRVWHHDNEVTKEVFKKKDA